MNNDRCPRELFKLHLADTIRRWLAAGDQLVVALDANEYVRSGTFTNSFLILDSKRQLLTSTDQQVPLRSPTVHALSMACLCPLRYSASGMVTGVSGWIPQAIAFGHDMPPIVRASARRLKVEDP